DVLFTVIRVHGRDTCDAGTQVLYGIGTGGDHTPVGFTYPNVTDVEFLVPRVVAEDELSPLLYTGVALDQDLGIEFPLAGTIVLESREIVEILNYIRFFRVIGSFFCRRVYGKRLRRRLFG